MLEVTGIHMPLDAGLNNSAGVRAQNAALAHSLGVSEQDLCEIRLLKRSVDARKKQKVHFIASFSFSLKAGTSAEVALLQKTTFPKGVKLKEYEPIPPLEVPHCATFVTTPNFVRPIVVGAGPAGLFCALYLARAGLAPLLVEQGQNIEERTRAVEVFSTGGPLNTLSNIQFGEGGAGTFSDGKLTTGIKSPHIRHILESFVSAGAPPEILYLAKPHIGTDILPDVVRNLRKSIIEAGGEVLFNEKLTNMRICKGKLEKIELTNTLNGTVRTLVAHEVVLACGHSARDTFKLLQHLGVSLERKPFSIGVRIEHEQAFINKAQYGKFATHPALGAADYKLATHLPDGRGVYTFCMCPGGSVVAATSEENAVCVNGMSSFARAQKNANSALLVDVYPNDLEGTDVLAGIAFQQKLERAAFSLARAAGGASYSAPAQTLGNFLGKAENKTSIEPSYPRGVAWCDLHACLPNFVTSALEEALFFFDRKLCGFAQAQAIMTGVETRSSSPVRIVRDERFQSISLRGLYPAGEGAGYAGGIMSSAVDGLRIAEYIATRTS